MTRDGRATRTNRNNPHAKAPRRKGKKEGKKENGRPDKNKLFDRSFSKYIFLFLCVFAPFRETLLFKKLPVTGGQRGQTETPLTQRRQGAKERRKGRRKMAGPTKTNSSTDLSQNISSCFFASSPLFVRPFCLRNYP